MENKTKIISITSLSIYAIINAMIYKWSFWSMFSINIMEFIAINDLLPSVVFSVSVPLIIFFMYVFFLELISSKTKSKDRTITPTAPIKERLKKSNIKWLIIFIIILISSMIYIDPIMGLKFFALLITSLSIGAIFIRIPNLKEELGRFRNFATVVVSCIPLVMFLAGIANASIVINDKNPIIVVSNSSCFNKNETYIYIGTVSDKAFAISIKDRSLCIFKYDYLKLQKQENLEHSEMEPISASRL